MTVTVEKLTEEPIIVATFANPMNYYVDVPEMFSKILELRETITGSPKYYIIIDMSAIKANFNEIVFSLGEARKASARRIPTMPASLHLVGAGDIFKMVADALGQGQYGGYKAPLYTSVDRALQVVHEELGVNPTAPTE